MKKLYILVSDLAKVDLDVQYVIKGHVTLM